MGDPYPLRWGFSGDAAIWARVSTAGLAPPLRPSPFQGLGMFCAPDPGLKPGALCRCPVGAPGLGSSASSSRQGFSDSGSLRGGWRRRGGAKSGDQGSALTVHGGERPLNCLDLTGFEERLTTLCTDPGGDRFPDDVVALPVDAERCCRAYHATFAVKAFHGQTRVRISASSITVLYHLRRWLALRVAAPRVHPEEARRRRASSSTSAAASSSCASFGSPLPSTNRRVGGGVEIWMDWTAID